MSAAVPSRNRTLWWSSALLDLLILSMFLFMPRSGMEQMAAGYVLLPLCILRIVLGTLSVVVATRNRQWGLTTYTLAAIAIMGWFWIVGAQLQPTYRPLHKVLRTEAQAWLERLDQSRKQRSYDQARARQRDRNPDHARLCDLLSVDQNLDALDQLLTQHRRPDLLEQPCASQYGAPVPPLLHLVIHTYGPWDGGIPLRTDADEAYVAPAAGYLLNRHADPNAQDSLGNTALHYAVIFGNEALVDTLLANGACVLTTNALQESPLSTHGLTHINRKIRAAADDPAMLARCPGVVNPAPPDNVEQADAPQQSPNEALLDALASGRLESAIRQLQRGANPNHTNHRGTAFEAVLKRCHDNSQTLLQLLLDAGADINLANRRGETPLRSAMHHCSAAVALLLQAGADPTIGDRNDNTPLHDLYRLPQDQAPGILEQLVAAGANVNQTNRKGRTPIMRLAVSAPDHIELAAALLRAGADPGLQDHNGNTALHLTAAARRTKADQSIAQVLLQHRAALEMKNNGQQTPLIIAVEHGKADMVELLLRNGANADVSRPRGAPLISAVISCDPDKLSKLDALLQAGADPNIGIPHGALPLAQALLNHQYLDCLEPARLLLAAGAQSNRLNRNGGAAIHNLAYWEQKDPAHALALLLAHGGDIDLPDHQGNTALLLAARHGSSLRTLQRLVESGADPRRSNQQGNTLLHCASMNSKPGAVERIAWILTQGGNPQQRNSAGQTALDLARSTGNTRVVDILQAL